MKNLIYFIEGTIGIFMPIVPQILFNNIFIIKSKFNEIFFILIYLSNYQIYYQEYVYC